MMRVQTGFAGALMIALAAPGMAKDWRQKEAGITLPDTIGDLTKGEVRDLSNGKGLDTIIQYGAGAEPVTLYVYRSTYPNAALWMDRTAAAMQMNVGASGVGVAAVPFTIGGAPAPNGLRRAINLPAGGNFRATGVAMAQLGEWMVKLRVTSATLDAASVSAKMDRILAGIVFDTPAPAPHPMIVPAACTDEAILTGAPVAKPRDDQVAMGAVMGAIVLARARGGEDGLAAAPDGWCRATQTGLPPTIVSVYRSKASGDLVALVGDSGKSITAITLDPALVPGGGAAAYASTAESTQLVALFDALPEPRAALGAAIPVIMGQGKGLVAISSERTRKK